MKIFILVLALLFTFSSVSAETDKGSISGIINHCDKGGIAGMQAFIPGKPHVVITGSDGRFSFSDVAAGDHSIHFMIDGKIMQFNKWVNVSSTKNSQLGLINVCDTTAAEHKDTAAPISPAAAASTPMVLNNANCSELKDDSLINIANGLGLCRGGNLIIKKCNKNYASCDEKAANGCETNISTDDENCGSCFNACASSDSCALGMC